MTILSIIAFGSLKAALLVLQYCIVGVGLKLGFTLFEMIQDKLSKRKNNSYINNLEKEVSEKA